MLTQEGTSMSPTRSPKSRSSSPRATPSSATQAGPASERAGDAASGSGGGPPSVVRVTPSLPRQIGEQGPLIFWRDGPAGTRVGLACAVETCRNPNCDCRDAVIHAFAIDSFTVSVEAAEGATALKTMRPAPTAGVPDPPSRKAVVRVDIDSGEVSPEGRAVDDELVRWIRDEVDGELLELLQRRWIRGKGREPHMPELDLPVEDWQGGELLNYGLVFLDDRDDVYLLDGRQYGVVDMYSPDPACSSKKVELFFEETKERQPPEFIRTIGGVRVRVPDGKELDFTPETRADEVLLRRLWDAYRERHDVARRLAERHARMREAGVAILARRGAAVSRPGAAVSTPGRNDPCPCGSGRKFKKCCGR
jgi:hypothetical protein